MKHRYRVGQVVRAYKGFPFEFFGVVVRMPTEYDNCYRVRSSTLSFTQFVEAGVPERNLDCSDEDWAANNID